MAAELKPELCYINPSEELFDKKFKLLHKIEDNQDLTPSWAMIKDVLPYIAGVANIYLGYKLHQSHKAVTGILSILGGVSSVLENALDSTNQRPSKSQANLLHAYQLITLFVGVNVATKESGVPQLHQLKNQLADATSHLFNFEGRTFIEKISHLRIFNYIKEAMSFNFQELVNIPHVRGNEQSIINFFTTAFTSLISVGGIHRNMKTEYAQMNLNATDTLLQIFQSQRKRAGEASVKVFQENLNNKEIKANQADSLAAILKKIMNNNRI